MRSEGLAAVLIAGFAVWLAGCRGAPPAERPPTRVVSVSPREGAVDIDPRAHAQIHFSTGLELGTIAADAIRLLGPDSAPVQGRLGFDIEGDVVNLQPARPLLSEAAYSLEGRLLVCFYEGAHTVHTFALSSDGKSVTDERPLVGRDDESLRFTQPLDLAVHPGARIYVADFGDWSSFGGGGAIWELEPVAPDETARNPGGS
jgi:hypothetical protein